MSSFVLLEGAEPRELILQSGSEIRIDGTRIRSVKSWFPFDCPQTCHPLATHRLIDEPVYFALLGRTLARNAIYFNEVSSGRAEMHGGWDYRGQNKLHTLGKKVIHGISLSATNPKALSGFVGAVRQMDFGTPEIRHLAKIELRLID